MVHLTDIYTDMHHLCLYLLLLSRITLFALVLWFRRITCTLQKRKEPVVVFRIMLTFWRCGQVFGSGKHQYKYPRISKLRPWRATEEKPRVVLLKHVDNLFCERRIWMYWNVMKYL
jgi:hypothetical protein